MPQPVERRHRRRRGPSLRIGSMNVRGICAPNRAQQLLRAWACKRYHIILLQECKADLFSATKVAAQLHGWRLYWAHSARAAAAAPRRSTAGPSPRCTLRGQRSSSPQPSTSGPLTAPADTSPHHSGGVAIAVRISALREHGGSLSVDSDWRSADGRLVSLRVRWGGHTLSVASMYAPAERSAQAAFFTSAVAMLQQRPGLPVWGGDFNFVEQPSLDRRTSRRSDAAELKVAAAWQQQLSSHSLHLVDTFRHSHPRRTTFSHFSPVGAARLDRIYAATALQRYVAEASVGGTPDCSVSDHRAVTLALLPTPAAGSCRALARRVRLHFTADPALRQAFRNAVAQAASTAPATPAAFLTWWPWFKRRLRAAAEHCNHRLRAARQQGSAAAGAALSQLYEQYEGGDDAGLGPLLQHRQRTAEAVKAELVAASMAERRQWLHAGERPSPTFTAKLRAPTSRGVAGLRAPDGTLHTAAPAVARLFVQQTARVSTEPSTDPAAQQEVLAAIAAGPQLSAQQAQQLGSTSIDAAEVRRALRRSKPGTAPGLDGIPVQLYRKFADVLAPLLARLFTSMGTTGSAPRGFNRGVISFLYKKGDPCLASNYRPITLLNTDYRLLSKVLAHRLGRCLHSLVSPEQAAFLRGRSIGENAHLLQLLPHLLARHGRWALVAFCDFRKAYDTVHRGFLLAVLRQLGLGDGFVSWVQLLLSHARGCSCQRLRLPPSALLSRRAAGLPPCPAAVPVPGAGAAAAASGPRRRYPGSRPQPGSAAVC